MRLPEEFLSRMQPILGAELPVFIDSLELESPISVRLNPLKKTELDLNLSDPVEWCPSAFYLPKRPSFTLDPNHHAGAYYVQEASSMAILSALKEWCLKTTKPLKILDLCAAPGGKSTLLRELGRQHLIVSNEVIRSRYQILKENITKWGHVNVMVTNHDVKDFKGLKNFFDIILIDAPCSGEGLFRKDHKARAEWSLANVNICTARQKRILGSTYELLAPEGLLIYSTCTYNNEENTANADWIGELSGYEPVEWSAAEKNKVMLKAGTETIGYQFFPHRTKGEGFYFTGLLKQDTGAIFKAKKSKLKGSTNHSMVGCCQYAT